MKYPAAKVSVSIPADVMVHASEAYPDVPFSQIVTMALTRMLELREGVTASGHNDSDTKERG